MLFQDNNALFIIRGKIPDRSFYILFIVWLLYLPFASAQDTNIVAFKSLGISFIIPPNWEGKESKGVYSLTSESNDGFVLISPWPFAEINTLKTQFEEGIKKESGFFLAPAEQMEIIGSNRLQGKFSGLIEFSPVVAYLVILQGEHQQTMLIISAIAKEKYAETQEAIAKKIAASFEFFKPIMPSLIDEYKDLLTDTKLTYVPESSQLDFDSETTVNNNVSSSYRSKITIDLCGQGYFNVYNFLPGSGSSAFSSNTNLKAGQWKIVKSKKGTVLLQLHFNDGEIEAYKLEVLAGEIYLDGDHFIRTIKGDTQYQPNCK